MGYALANVVNTRRGADLLEHIAQSRDEIATEWGLQIPHIHISDNLQLEPSAYVFNIRGVETVRGHRRSGDAVSLANHFSQIIIGHMVDLLDREQVRLMLDSLRTEYPATVEEVTSILSVGEIRRVLQALLSEEVSIRDLVKIIDSIADNASANRDIDYLVQHVRCALARQICLQHANSDGVLKVVTMSPELERNLRVENEEGDRSFTGSQENWILALNQAIASSTSSSQTPVVVATNIRALVKRKTREIIPRLVCIATAEVSSQVVVESVAEIQLESAFDLSNQRSTRDKNEDDRSSSKSPYLTAIELLLLHNDFESEIRQQVYREVCKHFSATQLKNRKAVHQFIAQHIGRTIVTVDPFDTDLRVNKGPHICTFVGPAGVGKTTAIAKLAAIFSLRNARQVRIITLDNDGIGTRQQIKTYAEIIGVPATVVDTSEELRDEIKAGVESDLIFIDTGAKSSSDLVEEMRNMIEITGYRKTTHLVVSATTKYSDLKQTVHRFESFSCDSIIVTKLDETTTIGNIVSILLSSGLPVSFLCDGQKGLQSLQPASVLRFLLLLDQFEIDQAIIENEFGDGQTIIMKNKQRSPNKRLVGVKRMSMRNLPVE